MKYTKRQMEFHVQKNFVGRCWDLYALLEDNGKLFEATTLNMEPHEELAGVGKPPLLSLTEFEATQLMDQLWNAGVRPSQEGTMGQLAATKYHLEDMRKLVFEKQEEIIEINNTKGQES